MSRALLGRSLGCWLIAALAACATPSGEKATLRTNEEKMFQKTAEYERFMGRWSRKLAPLYVPLAKVKDGDRILDVGSGTGALASALESRFPSSQIVGVDPSSDFVDAARASTSSQRVTFAVGDAQALGFKDGEFDTTLAQLVMNFVPDHQRAVGEMRRVTRKGGTVSACVWDYRDGMEMLQIFFDELVRAEPAMAEHDERNMKLCRQGELAELWRSSGLVHVEERALEFPMEFVSFDDYWSPFLLGVGPSGALVASLSEDRRVRLRERLRERLLADRHDSPFTLRARAWCAIGEVP